MEIKKATIHPSSIVNDRDDSLPDSVPASRKLSAFLVVMFTIASVIIELIVDSKEWGTDVESRGWLLSLLETLMIIVAVLVVLTARRSIIGLIITASVCAYFIYAYIYPMS